eukprot:5128856-Prymnesium_polylepis.1
MRTSTDRGGLCVRYVYAESGMWGKSQHARLSRASRRLPLHAICGNHATHARAAAKTVYSRTTCEYKGTSGGATKGYATHERRRLGLRRLGLRARGGDQR